VLTPEQADAVADELLEQRRHEHVAVKNAGAPRVPFVYYVRGLNALEPYERSEVVHLALHNVGNQWKATVVSLAVVCVCCAVWWLAGLFAKPGAVPLVALCIATLYFPRAYFVRQEVRRLVRESQDAHPKHRTEV
jgi:Flp pilus assembly protein TadB